jgi:serine/threonine-protein kinase Chk1
LVKILGYCDEEFLWRRPSGRWYKAVFIVLELAPNGDLFDLMNQAPYSEPICRFYFKQLIDGVAYLHSRALYHRDIKSENMLLDENYNLRLGDYGFMLSLEPG